MKKQKKVVSVADRITFATIVCGYIVLPWTLVQINSLIPNLIIIVIAICFTWTYVDYLSSRDVACDKPNYGGVIKFNDIVDGYNHWAGVINDTQWVKYRDNNSGTHYYLSSDYKYIFSNIAGLIDTELDHIDKPHMVDIGPGAVSVIREVKDEVYGIDSTVFDIGPGAMVTMRGVIYTVSYLDSIRLKWASHTNRFKFNINCIKEIS